MIDKLHIIEINFLQELLQHRPEFLDVFFRFLNFFDTIFFYIILICLIWAMFWRWGIRLFFVVIFSGIINNLLKMLFMMPRPSDIDPSLGLVSVTGYGFPSGAAQTTLLLAMLFITSFKELKKVWLASFIFVFLIAVSRVYLGVHFISDIFGGWIFAMILFIFYLLLITPFEKLLSKMNYISVFVMIEIVAALLLLLPFTVRWTYPYFAMGIGLGYLVSCKFHMFLDETKNIKEIIIKLAISLAGVFSLFISYPLLFKTPYIYLIVSMLMGFWIAYITSLIYKSLIMKHIDKGSSL